MSHPDPQSVVADLWTMCGMPQKDLSHLSIEISEDLPSRFHVGVAASSVISAQALMAAKLWALRTGKMQDVVVPMRRALASFRAERYLHVDGELMGERHDELHGYYPVGERQWVQLHTAFPHHKQGVLRILGCEPTRDAVTAALKNWQAEQLETQLAAAGLVGAAVRSHEQWRTHPHAASIAGLPLFEVLRIGDAPVEPLGRGADPHRPLSGVRVLDLSRVIAAPVAARTLAQHGADVLAVSAPHLPQVQPFLIDTGRGKRQTYLDLRDEQDADRLRQLVMEADVFVQAYRPGGLAERGFSPEALARLRPGLVYVTLSAYGHVGPWSNRRGYDSLVQSATGIAHAEAEAAGLQQPGKLPCQALDHASGYLAALGAMVALHRRATEGGSWLVRVSLAQTGQWLRKLGERENGYLSADLTQDEVRPWLQIMQTPFGEVKAVCPAEIMSETPPRFDQVCVPCGTHEPAWLRVS